jgi:hypothetical protein
VSIAAYRWRVLRLEEIVYQARRDALADQDAVVTGIRQRTGTLLAAHALVASFLGATAVKAKGLHGWGWWALATLVLGLALAAILLSNWKLSFAIDAQELYEGLYDDAAREPSTKRWVGWCRPRTVVSDFVLPTRGGLGRWGDCSPRLGS